MKLLKLFFELFRYYLRPVPLRDSASWLERTDDDIKAGLLNLHHKHRSILGDYILHSNLSDLSDYRVLEIGCGYGANLIDAAERFPKMRFYGIELNPKSVRFGHDLLHKKNISNVYLECRDANTLTEFEFDLIFFDALFMYLNMKEAKRLLHRVMVRPGTRILICELTNPLPYPVSIRIRDGYLHNFQNLALDVSKESIGIHSLINQFCFEGNWKYFGKITEFLV